MSDPFGRLEREVDLLDRRVRAWSGGAWAAPTGGRGAVTRADVVAGLAARLDALGREAGVPVPVDTALPRVPDHALADQVVVLAGDLLAALRRAPAGRGQADLARVAADAVHEARAHLG